MSLSSKLIKIGNTSEIKLNQVKTFTINNQVIAIFNLKGKYYAIDNRCPHQGASLSQGKILDDCQIECPWHGACFSIKTGQAMTLPATSNLKTYPLTIKDNIIYLNTN